MVDLVNKLLLLLIVLPRLTGSSKPYQKRQQAVWRIECELGLVTDPECPIDGGWSAWSTWSECRGRCDDVGHRRRTRMCVNPAPANDGLPCSGADEDSQPCYVTDCTAEHFRILVEGDAVRTQAFQQLQTMPALAERCLQRECGYGAVEAALATDNTWQVEECDGDQCAPGVSGGGGRWSAWSEWTSCSERCGAGVRRRRRACLDRPAPQPASGAWTTLCIGQHEEIEVCENEECHLDGGWSGWGSFGPCSRVCGAGNKTRHRRRQHEEIEVCENEECHLDGGWSGWGGFGPCSRTCGAGNKSRARSCTRPSPAGVGRRCVGSETEFGSCYQRPCDAYTHEVAVFSGDSYLHYNLKKKRSVLLHVFVRFLPQSPHGTLVRRGTVRKPHVRLSLQRWHVCLDASGVDECSLPRVCSPMALEPDVWHSALIAITNEAATLRLDDAITPIKTSFPCDPDLPNAKMNLMVGERFHGQIQDLILNFIPLPINAQRELRSNRAEFSPTSSSNVAFEPASLEEGYLTLNDDYYLRLPCFDAQDQWQLEITFKPKRDSGSLVFLKDDASESWLHVALQNMRLKLKVAVGELRSESSSTTECLPDEWVDVKLLKKKETNTIEASLSSGERLHAVLDEEPTHTHTYSSGSKHVSLSLCSDEFFVGGTPADINANLKEEITSFSGVIGSLSINGVMQDLYAMSMERNKHGQVQLSSRSASVSGAYHEAAWGSSNGLNLSCLHARTARHPRHVAHWLYLDTTLAATPSFYNKAVRSLDDGRVLKLIASADNDLRGFYTCRAHYTKRTVNVVTYGVTGKIKYNLSQPDTTTTLAVITTFTLVAATLGWLIIEGIYDLRTGFGFFRDAHLTPEQEADAVCRYIDENKHLVGSDSAVKLAKARARNRARKLTLASRSSFAAQEPQGLMQIENRIEELVSEPDELPVPALPCTCPLSQTGACSQTPACSQTLAQPVPGPSRYQPIPGPSRHQQLFRCELSFTSSGLPSPRSPPSRLTSSPDSSPRYLCSRLLLAKKIHSSKQSLWAKKRRATFNCNFDMPQRVGCNLQTIKSAMIAGDTAGTAHPTCAISPAHNILRKFQQLKCDD